MHDIYLRFPASSQALALTRARQCRTALSYVSLGFPRPTIEALAKEASPSIPRSMRSIRTVGISLLAGIVMASPAARADRSSSRQFTSVGAIQRAAAVGGVTCGAFRKTRPVSHLERDEGRCLSFAAATFTGRREQKAWLHERLTEPWFPARFLIVGSRWVVWTWTRPRALALHRALGGAISSIAPPPARPRSVSLCGHCASPPPARPVPRGLLGPVYSFASERWPASETLADGGLDVVSKTAPGTAAVTGILVDRRSGSRHKYVSGMRVVLESDDGTTDETSTVRITTVSEGQGGFAFIDVPVAPEGTCYTIHTEAARGFGAMSYTALLWASPFEATEELLDIPQAESDGACPSSADEALGGGSGSRSSSKPHVTPLICTRPD